jgi:hypothetical protein
MKYVNTIEPFSLYRRRSATRLAIHAPFHRFHQLIVRWKHPDNRFILSVTTRAFGIAPSVLQAEAVLKTR